MPTYDYVCQACQHTFEQFQEMSAKKLRTCPKCGKRSLERQVGAGAGLIFKGTGFYITDYRRGGTAPESVDGQKSESKSETPAPSAPDATRGKGTSLAAPGTTEGASPKDSKSPAAGDGGARSPSPNQRQEQSQGKGASKGRGTGQGKRPGRG